MSTGILPDFRIVQGDALQVLGDLPPLGARCVVTSPPYWGLRDYGTGKWVGGDPTCAHRSPTMRAGRRENRELLPGSPASNQRQLLLLHNRPCGKCGAEKVDDQIGLEEAFDDYVHRLVAVFEVIRTKHLADDGTLWLNLGDTYNGSGGSGGDYGAGGNRSGQAKTRGRRASGLKPKDLVGVPWAVAFALRAAGWYLRAEIVWDKIWTRPEGGARDRTSRRHETLFLLSKSRRYFCRPTPAARFSVWPLRPSAGKGDHRAQFPIELPTLAIGSATEPGDLVLDPFSGYGTTGKAAILAGRKFVGVDLSERFVAQSKERLRGDSAGPPVMPSGPIENQGILDFGAGGCRVHHGGGA